MKVLTIFGTRPEAIKMAPIVRQLARFSGQGNLQSVNCVTAQHRQMLDQVLRTFCIRPDIDLDLMQRDQNLAALSASALTQVTAVLRRERPDLVLVQGHTTTAMIGALASFYEKIRLGHVEAGLRTGDRQNPFPEEVNRRLIAILASLHFAPTASAVENLRREGITRGVYLTGNTGIDALLWVVRQTPSAETLAMLARMGFPCQREIRPEPAETPATILVTAHRRENFGEPLREICRALLKIVQHNPNVRIAYPVHRNPNVCQIVGRMLAGRERIHLTAPLSYECFAHAMQRTRLIITDSGGVQEEAPALGKPVLVVRNQTERPEAVAAGCVRLVGTEQERIVRETDRLLQDRDTYMRMARAISPYGDGHAAERILAAITSRAAPSAGNIDGPAPPGISGTEPAARTDYY